MTAKQKNAWTPERKAAAAERMRQWHATKDVATPVAPQTVAFSIVSDYKIERIGGMYYALREGEVFTKRLMGAMTPREAVKVGQKRWAYLDRKVPVADRS